MPLSPCCKAPTLPPGSDNHLSTKRPKPPITLWWGERDDTTPVPIAHDFERRLPDVTLKLVDGTHQLLFSRWREILADAAPRTRP